MLTPLHNPGSEINRGEVAKIIKDFMLAVEQVITTTGRTQIKSRTKAATLTEHAQIDGDAAGLLPFQVDYSGLIIISFTKEVICEIATNMLYSAIRYTNHREPDVEGAIGELTNHISGPARLRIHERTGWKTVNGIPSVVVGENISWILYTTGALVVHVPYTTPEQNELYIETAVIDHPSIGEIKIP